ncbi:MAG: hypothetical protein FWB93_02940 [Oscillospiraceae bacterium]|nr:hypothetical protein [Oscillospiraceae bacterium]
MKKLKKPVVALLCIAMLLASTGGIIFATTRQSQPDRNPDLRPNPVEPSGEIEVSPPDQFVEMSEKVYLYIRERIANGETFVDVILEVIGCVPTFNGFSVSRGYRQYRHWLDSLTPEERAEYDAEREYRQERMLIDPVWFVSCRSTGMFGYVTWDESREFCRIQARYWNSEIFYRDYVGLEQALADFGLTSTEETRHQAQQYREFSAVLREYQLRGEQYRGSSAQ